MTSQTILVADDNHDSADSLVDLLRAAGYEAQAAYDGEEALAVGRRSRPAIALLDVQMPGIDGCETARRLRDQPDGPQYIASISGLSPEEEPMRSLGCNFDAHFRKPTDLVKLLNFVRCRLQPKPH